MSAVAAHVGRGEGWSPRLLANVVMFRQVLIVVRVLKVVEPFSFVQHQEDREENRLTDLRDQGQAADRRRGGRTETRKDKRLSKLEARGMR